MYAPASFIETRSALLVEAIRTHPFATLLVNGEAGPIAAYAPLVPKLREDGSVVALMGHVARANPFWKAARNAPALAIFSGPDLYVSPAYYPSKAVDGRVVPTWNYIRIEARGLVDVVEDPQALHPFVDAPTTAMEAGRPEPWSRLDAPQDYIEALLSKIVGLTIHVASLEGAFKLSQNRNSADVDGVIAGAEQDGAAVAEWMRRYRKERDR